MPEHIKHYVSTPAFSGYFAYTDCLPTPAAALEVSARFGLVTRIDQVKECEPEHVGYLRNPCFEDQPVRTSALDLTGKWPSGKARCLMAVTS